MIKLHDTNITWCVSESSRTLTLEVVGENFSLSCLFLPKGYTVSLMFWWAWFVNVGRWKRLTELELCLGRAAQTSGLLSLIQSSPGCKGLVWRQRFPVSLSDKVDNFPPSRTEKWRENIWHRNESLCFLFGSIKWANLCQSSSSCSQ